MWIARKEKKDRFLKILHNLNREVLVVRGARQVGKTSFVQNAFKALNGAEICQLLQVPHYMSSKIPKLIEHIF